MTAFSIDIVSDTVCPWCYIGHKRLSNAIESHLKSNPNDTFKTRWFAYQLNPRSPEGKSTDKAEYYASKFGPQQAQAIFSRLRAAGEPDGINFSFGGKTGNTHDSHRLIAFAAQKENGQNTEGRGLQTKVVEELFAEYFEKEGDITDHEVLLRAAVKAGMKEHEVKNMLDSGALGDHVDKEVREGQLRGVSGVPDFTINDQFEISGGQEPAAFLQIFKRIKMLEEKQSDDM